MYRLATLLSLFSISIVLGQSSNSVTVASTTATTSQASIQPVKNDAAASSTASGQTSSTALVQSSGSTTVASSTMATSQSSIQPINNAGSASNSDGVTCSSQARSSAISDDDFNTFAIDLTFNATIEQMCRPPGENDTPYCDIFPCSLPVVVAAKWVLNLTESTTLGTAEGSAGTDETDCVQNFGDIVSQCIDKGFAGGSIANKNNVALSASISTYVAPPLLDSSEGSLFFDADPVSGVAPLPNDELFSSVFSMKTRTIPIFTAEPISVVPTAPIADAFTTMTTFSFSATNTGGPAPVFPFTA